jgi:hypothetical protein
MLFGTFENLNLTYGNIHEKFDQYPDRTLFKTVEGGKVVSTYIFFENGNSYTGERNGVVPHGKGTMYRKDGTDLEGIFENGEYVGPAE